MVSSRIDRCVTIEKFRGSAHDTLPRPMSITDKGITVDAGKKVSKATLKELQLFTQFAR